MPKETYLQRYSIIVKRLEKSPATFEQIARYLEEVSDIEDKELNISLRTFQRDIRDIYKQMGIEIANEKKGDKKYFIKSRPEIPGHSERLLEAYDMVNVLKASQDNLQHVFFETRKPAGLEHFSGFLYAIKNKKTVGFTHYNIWQDMLTDRTVHPLALKEARGRWYLIAVDKKDDKLKTFGLDRISDLDISKASYKVKYNYDLKGLFAHSFGIMYDTAQAPPVIQLSFTYEQGKYIKTYPLHHSQKIIEDTEDEVLVELTMIITHDLIMELLSYGEDMRVVAPASLIEQVKGIFNNVLVKYT